MTPSPVSCCSARSQRGVPVQSLWPFGCPPVRQLCAVHTSPSEIDVQLALSEKPVSSRVPGPAGLSNLHRSLCGHLPFLAQFEACPPPVLRVGSPCCYAALGPEFLLGPEPVSESCLRRCGDALHAFVEACVVSPDLGFGSEPVVVIGARVGRPGDLLRAVRDVDLVFGSQPVVVVGPGAFAWEPAYVVTVTTA
jgi:hypothetical protein